jgi:hypothetical protein
MGCGRSGRTRESSREGPFASGVGGAACPMNLRRCQCDGDRGFICSLLARASPATQLATPPGRASSE